MFGRRILILVPHPDDEVVMATEASARAKAAGAEIMTLYLTNGCIARETLWPWQRRSYDRFVARRRAEGEEAARFLGLSPVGWAQRPARTLWRALDQIFDDVVRVVKANDIDQLWVPAYEGGNADHDGLNALGYALAKALQRPDAPNDTPPVLEFAAYNFLNGTTCAQTFPFPNGTETTLRFDDRATARKKQALRLYRSEKQNLNYVGTAHECFRPLAGADYARPPHEGTLWYARFQWVPFRHPRVDFTRPAEVCAAIQHFLASR
jgi:LmbE family N-acetylglucosaminyl deacetylase